MNNKKIGISSIILTSFILILLIFAGPAQALSIDFFIQNADNGEYDVKKGKTVRFTIDVSDIMGDVQELKLVLEGPDGAVCKFEVNGDKISGCSGITINLIEYGYGYGYGYYTHASYEIFLDTDYFDLGTYDTELKVLVDGNWITEEGDQLIIKSDSDNSSRCQTTWSCTQWGDCINGKQIRSCVKRSLFCDAGARPSEKRSCLVMVGDYPDQAIKISPPSKVDVKKSELRGFEFQSNWIIAILLAMGIILLLFGIIVAAGRRNRSRRGVLAFFLIILILIVDSIFLMLYLS